MDPILLKLTIAYITGEVAKYTKKQDIRNYALDKIIYYATHTTVDDPCSHVEDVIEHMFITLDTKCGIDIDYTFSDDVQDQAEAIITKWEAYNNGVGEDMLDILDI